MTAEVKGRGGRRGAARHEDRREFEHLQHRSDDRHHDVGIKALFLADVIEPSSIVNNKIFTRTNLAASALTNRWQQRTNDNAAISINFNLTFSILPYTFSAY